MKVLFREVTLIKVAIVSLKRISMIILNCHLISWIISVKSWIGQDVKILSKSLFQKCLIQSYWWTSLSFDFPRNFVQSAANVIKLFFHSIKLYNFITVEISFNCSKTVQLTKYRNYLYTKIYKLKLFEEELLSPF